MFKIQKLQVLLKYYSLKIFKVTSYFVYITINAYQAYKAYFILISFVCNTFRMPGISEELRHHVIIKMKEEANQKKVARDLNM